MRSQMQRVLNNVIRSKLPVVLVVYLVMAIFFVPYVGMNLPYSVYYHLNPEVDLERINEENHRRVREAEMTLKSFNATNYNQFLNRTRKHSRFCFVIPSVSRPAEVRYLTQVVASLLPQIAGTDSVFTVLNAEGPRHTEAKNLSSIVPVEAIGANHSSVYVKETMDYVLALEWCQRRGATFSVILEDDVIVGTDFMERLKFTLQYRVPRDNTWAFLKLYYPEKWEGWGNERRLILELVATALLGGIFLTALIYMIQLLLLRTLPTMNKLELFYLFAIYVLSCAFVLYLLLTLGRPHWLSLRKFNHHLSSVVPAPGCCTPAVLYPEVHLPDIIRYLKHTNRSGHFPLDIALDKFANSKGLERLLVVPNMVRHIGFVSSLGKHGQNPHQFRLVAATIV